MKNTNKKGFTLVELIIVIVVIAVLAGVLIGTFASVINKANKSAEIQKIKSEELAVKAEDILKKIEDANWYGWADFENSIVEKIAAKYDENSSSYLTTEQMKKAVSEALEEYGQNNAQEYSTLTEEQVKAIVENALGTLKYEGVTEEQVRTIVNAAVTNASANQLTVAQVRAIVNAANTNNLTSTEVANIVARALATTEGTLEEKIDAAVNTLKGEVNNIVTLTEEDVDSIITKLVPVTKKVDSVSKFNDAVANLNSGSTIVIDSSITNDLTIDLGDEYKSLYIKGKDYQGILTIDAKNADIKVLGNIATIDATSVAPNSLHILGYVKLLLIKSGRAVVESGFKVDTLVAIPSKDSTVKIVVSENAEIDKLYAQYQDHKNDGDEIDPSTKDYIYIENNGTVGNSAITASAALADSGDTTTNVVITNSRNATGTEVGDVKVEKQTPTTLDENVEIPQYDVPAVEVSLNVNGSNDEPTKAVTGDNNLIDVNNIEGVARIGTTGYATLQGAIDAAQAGDVVVLLQNVTGDKITITKSITLDGANYTLKDTNTNGRAIWIDETNVTFTIKNITIDGDNKCQRGLQVNVLDYWNNATIYMDNCVIKNMTYYAINFCSNTTVDMTITNSSISGWAALNAYGTGNVITAINSEFIGKNNKSFGSSNNFATICLEGDTTGQTDLHSSDYTITFTNCSLEATQTTGNKQAILGFNNHSQNSSVTFTDCTFNIGEGCYFGYDKGNTEYPNTLTIDGELLEMPHGYFFDIE